MREWKRKMKERMKEIFKDVADVGRLFFSCLILILIIIGLVVILYKTVTYLSNSQNITTSDNIRQVKNDSYIYEYIDKDTGVHYLITLDTGGITPRLNNDGSVMIDDNENKLDK